MAVGTNILSLLNIPGGGWMTRMEFAADGTAVGRYDVHEGQIFIPSVGHWQPILRHPTNYNFFTDVLDIPGEHPTADSGGHDVAICWSNSNYVGIISNGNLLLSSNKTATMTVNTAFGRLGADYGGNFGAQRVLYKRLQFDPNNPQGIAFADYRLGLKYSIDGGTSWAMNASIPAPTSPYGAEVMYDRNSALLSGRTSRVIVYSHGNGIYESTTGIEGTFSLISGSPTKTTCIWIAPNGALWCTDASAFDMAVAEVQAPLKRWQSGSWFSVPGDANSYPHKVCVDPNNSDLVYTVRNGGEPSVSTNGTATTPTFTAPAVNTRLALDAPWLTSVPGGNYMANGSPVVHPITGELWTSEGLGFWKLPSPSTAIATGTVQWQWVGQENYTLICSDTKVMPNGRLLAGHQDKSLFLFNRSQIKTNMLPATRNYPLPNTSLRNHTNSDFILSDPNQFVWAVNNGRSGLTLDGGVTEKYFEIDRMIAVIGTEPFNGCIALTGDQRGFWSPTNNVSPLWFEPDGSGGFNFGHLDFGSSLVNDAIRSQAYPKHQGYYLSRQHVIADKYRPGTGYFYVIGDFSGSAADLAARGIWKTTDHGKTWTRIRSTFIIGYAYDFWNARFKQPLTTPDTNVFFWHCGPVGGPPWQEWEPDPTSKLHITTDNMVTWTAITGFEEVTSYGLGAPAPGHNFSAIRLYAQNGPAGRGCYQCLDFNPAAPNSGTWTKLADSWNNTIEQPVDQEGDPNLFGRWYFGTKTGYRVNRFLHRGSCV